jgi:uroporphyrinogen decarboxylase
MAENHDFIRACYGKPVSRTPVWLMRQAGRYLPQYRTIRERVAFLDLCKTPELAAEVTLQPVDALGVDAAILFSDILIPVEAMGQHLHYQPAPVLNPPVRTASDVESLRLLQPEQDVPFVLETIRLLRRELEGCVPLIGFGGAPFTLACYMVEGCGSRHFLALKSLMFRMPEIYARLMDKITDASIVYLRAQVSAGAQALQIFDSWGGILAPTDYRRYVLPYSRRLLSALEDLEVPLIHFVKGAGTMLDLVASAGGHVVGLDWGIGLGQAREILGDGVAVQGNLDPAVLLGTQAVIESEVRRILDENGGRPGHVFNLGHGIVPEVPPANAAFLVDCVHRLSQR